MAIDLTGISNVNEFYSHHYLDSLLEGDLKGLFKKWNEQDERSPYEKLSGVTHKYFLAKKEAFVEKKPEDRVEVTQNFHVQFLSTLGYRIEPTTKFTADGHAIPVLMSEKRDGNEYVWALETVFWDDDISIFEQPLVLKKKDEVMNWLNNSIDLAIQHIFRIEEPPRWIILLAGQKVYLIDRNKWGQGKYLLFDLDELFGRKQAETLKATSALLAKDTLAPEEGNILHDELDENSHKHAFSVSEDLKYGIRRAVELIGNEYIYYHSKINKQKLYGDEELAGRLTKECLTYLYRLLFLFYAESRSEELNVVPMKSEEYRLGYSLETIRDLEQVPLTTKKSMEGYYIHQSLNTLFKIVNEGFGKSEQIEIDVNSGKYLNYGFEIDGLQSPLFDSKQTQLLSSVKFRNFVLQEVIQLLSLSKEGSKQRGRISYAQLGINQLGAVYEGLLSYSGFFAQETMYEVKLANVSSLDETGQTYFVPGSNVEQFKEDEFVYVVDDNGSKMRKKYDRGSFIFRLAGQDREQSASYYTPEVLTQALIRYSVKELIKEKSADEIIDISICEPAMGSGAFLNETINQLADAYLEKKQKELQIKINPELYHHEKQKVKSFLATNNVYGVDLNSTAIELAKVSLWLNTIYKDGKTPWFSARISVGNSLISARRSIYNEVDLLKGKWHEKEPKKILKNRSMDSVYHFLIPDKGMALFEKDQVVKGFAKSDIERIKQWRNEFTTNFEKSEIDSLKNISKRIDGLWNRHYVQRSKMLKIINEEINVWGQNQFLNETRHSSIDIKEKELMRIIKSPTSPYRALKMVLDYWCSLWFWPIDKSKFLPTRDEFLLDISAILDTAEGFGTNIDNLVNSFERFSIINQIAEKMKFFHWELNFVEIFYDKSGFDLIIGNPPWIRVSFEEKPIFAEQNPLIDLRKYSANKIKQYRNEFLSKDQNKQTYLQTFVEKTGIKNYLGSKSNYPNISGKVNLYKTFIELGWNLTSKRGLVSFVHPEGVFDDPKGGKFREEIYRKLIYHFQFINELKLFSEIGNINKFSLNIYRSENKDIDFKCIFNLFHPKTIEECFTNNGQGEVPGYKNKDFNWDLRGHRDRIIEVNEDFLINMSEIFGKSDSKSSQVILPSLHSNQLVSSLQKLSTVPKLFNFKEKYFTSPSQFWNETNSQEDGTIKRDTQLPKSISDFVFSGPHFYVGCPFYQTPNEDCKNHRDYSKININSISSTYIPRTNYIPNCSDDEFLERIPSWKGKKAHQYFSLIARSMLNLSGERTLITAIKPKLSTQINTTITLTFEDIFSLVRFTGYSHSIVLDAYIKANAKNHIYENSFDTMPFITNKYTDLYIINRTLRLNCLTEHYSDLWEEIYNSTIQSDSFSKNDKRLSNWSNLNKEWSWETPLRNDFERRQALIEIDVLTALAINLTFEELLNLYKVQFAVLQKYEAENYYDQQGKLVPKNILNYYHANINEIDKADPNLVGFITPFEKCDREADMRQAYEHFSKKLKEKS
jgi:hypothetical protein